MPAASQLNTSQTVMRSPWIQGWLEHLPGLIAMRDVIVRAHHWDHAEGGSAVTRRRARSTFLARGPDCLNLLQFVAAHQVTAAQPGTKFAFEVQAVEEEQKAHHIHDRKQCVLAGHLEPPRG